jgi:hypothetical protein
MKQSKLEALLGRSLIAREVTNLTLYLDISKEAIQELLCMYIECGGYQEARTYEPREGYSTVFTDIFTNIEEVKVDDVAVTGYHEAFFDKRNGDFYNSIVFTESLDGTETIEITADWGFNKIPDDLARLWAQMFAIVSKKRATGSVKSKQVEDFRITYGDLSDEELFEKDNHLTIKKYKMCDIGYVKHGSTCALHGVYRCGQCIR